MTMNISKRDLSVSLVLIILLTGLAMLACSGCAVITIHDPSTNHTVARAVVPAWPWQDSNQAVRRLALSARTNNFTLGISGITQSESTSTNATAALGQVIGEAAKTALGLK